MDQNSTAEWYSETSTTNYSTSIDAYMIVKLFIDRQWVVHDNMVLITLYVPLLVLAAAANILVIVVVVRYHYMRR
jgi:hypothetical protein